MEREKKKNLRKTVSQAQFSHLKLHAWFEEGWHDEVTSATYETTKP